MNHAPARALLSALFLLALPSACEEKSKPSSGAAPTTGAPAASPSAAATPASEPKDIVIDAIGVKVGFSRVLLDKPEGEQRLREELTAAKTSFTGKDVTIAIERAAKLPWATRVFAELSKLSPSSIVVKTDTRKEFPNELVFVPLPTATNPAPCSVIAMVLEDRATAVWKLSGGTAIKRARGFAGPDLSTTGETLERFGKACKDSPLLFVAAAPPIEWGLVFDLAASAKALGSAPFQRFVALPEPPTPGRRVQL